MEDGGGGCACGAQSPPRRPRPAARYRAPARRIPSPSIKGTPVHMRACTQGRVEMPKSQSLLLPPPPPPLLAHAAPPRAPRGTGGAPVCPFPPPSPSAPPRRRQCGRHSRCRNKRSQKELDRPWASAQSRAPLGRRSGTSWPATEPVAAYELTPPLAETPRRPRVHGSRVHQPAQPRKRCPRTTPLRTTKSSCGLGCC